MPAGLMSSFAGCRTEADLLRGGIPESVGDSHQQVRGTVCPKGEQSDGGGDFRLSEDRVLGVWGSEGPSHLTLVSLWKEWKHRVVIPGGHPGEAGLI